MQVGGDGDPRGGAALGRVPLRSFQAQRVAESQWSLSPLPGHGNFPPSPLHYGTIIPHPLHPFLRGRGSPFPPSSPPPPLQPLILPRAPRLLCGGPERTKPQRSAAEPPSTRLPVPASQRPGLWATPHTPTALPRCEGCLAPSEPRELDLPLGTSRAFSGSAAR